MHDKPQGRVSARIAHVCTPAHEPHTMIHRPTMNTARAYLATYTKAKERTQHQVEALVSELRASEAEVMDYAQQAEHLRRLAQLTKELRGTVNRQLLELGRLRWLQPPRVPSDQNKGGPRE